MAQVLEILSIISFAVAGVSFVLAVFFWFFFKIPAVFGDLSGRTARKSIDKMRLSNEKTGSKGYRESRTNVERGRLTDTIDNNKPKNTTSKIAQSKKQTEKGQQNKKAVRPTANVTPPPANVTPETGLLGGSDAGIPMAEETAYLGSETTGLLVENEITGIPELENTQPVRTGGKQLVMLDVIMFIHTDEVIG